MKRALIIGLFLLMFILPLVSAQNKPDLVISGLSISHYDDTYSTAKYYIGDKVAIEMIVRNQGTSPADMTRVYYTVSPSQIQGVDQDTSKFFYGSYGQGSFPIPQDVGKTTLNPGEQEVYHDYFTINSSSFVIVAKVDSDNKISEENETNNVLEQTYTFAATPSCYDSDGGKNYYLKGQTTGASKCVVQEDCSSSAVKDICGKDANIEGNPQTSNSLEEYFCKEGYRYVDFYECPKGCKDGACLSETKINPPIPNEPTQYSDYLIEKDILQSEGSDEDYIYLKSDIGADWGLDIAGNIEQEGYVADYKCANGCTAKATVINFDSSLNLEDSIKSFCNSSIALECEKAEIDGKLIYSIRFTRGYGAFWNYKNKIITTWATELCDKSDSSGCLSIVGIAKAYLAKYPSEVGMAQTTPGTVITPTPIVIVTPIGTVSCQGCVFDSTCLAYGHRIKINGTPSYCEALGASFMPQKEKEEECQNDYECLTNDCKDGKCVSTYTLLQAIFDFIKSIFGSK
jgi:hypothetical protein